MELFDTHFVQIDYYLFQVKILHVVVSDHYM